MAITTKGTVYPWDIDGSIDSNILPEISTTNKVPIKYNYASLSSVEL